MNHSHAIVFVAMIATACVLTIPQAAAQEVPASPQNKMVLLHVRVTNSMGRVIAGVPQDGIVVTEDGVPQKIALFVNDETPLTYGLMIDSSGSVRSQYGDIIRAAQQIIESNRPADETFLVRFVSSDKIEAAQGPTSNKAFLRKVLDEYYIEGGSSAVIDAVYLSAQKLAEQKMDLANLRRRVLVLITDGEDRASYYKPEHLFNLLAATDVQIFTIGLNQELKPQSRDKAVNLLNRLAAATGGRAFFASSSSQIEPISQELMHEIRTECVIGYVPAGIDESKGAHKIQIAFADNANQDKSIVITRVGYSTQN
jgi:Ca-activated chloride channel family protein